MNNYSGCSTGVQNPELRQLMAQAGLDPYLKSLTSQLSGEISAELFALFLQVIKPDQPLTPAPRVIWWAGYFAAGRCRQRSAPWAQDCAGCSWRSGAGAAVATGR
ncbi:hypothetical protein CWS02_13955 [Enterobacter sp. EA-1]|nr:hypothetical protein CWS02_13955 [Enterobacter sp. EA-1]